MECEFDDILNYLEKQEKIINEKEGSHRNVENPHKSKKLENVKKEIPKDIEKPKKNERLKVEEKSIIVNKSDNTIINNTGISRGFDPDKFLYLMKSKIVSEDKRYKQFRSKEFLSVTEIFLCPRQVYYSRKNFPENKYIYPNLLLIREAGKAIHKTIQSVYPFDKCEDTIKSFKFKVKGKYDGLVDNSIIELKTIDRDKLYPLDGSPFTYQDEHFYQGTIYAYILNHEFNFNIDNISIVYITRDLKDKKPPVFNLKPNDSIAEKFLNRALMIHDCIARDQSPTINKSEWDCQWCPFKKYCKEEEENNSKSKTKSKFLL